jgi:hypothetical protein
MELLSLRSRVNVRLAPHTLGSDLKNRSGQRGNAGSFSRVADLENLQEV